MAFANFNVGYIYKFQMNGDDFERIHIHWLSWLRRPDGLESLSQECW